MGCAASTQTLPAVAPAAGSSAEAAGEPAAAPRAVTFAGDAGAAPASGATPKKPELELLPGAPDDSRSSATSEYHQSPAGASPAHLGAGWNGVLTMKLAEANVHEAEDNEEWALTRMETLCRLSPLRLARKVMDQREGAIDQETFFDHTTCAVLFVDYSRVCELTTALFKKQGIFVRPKSLATTLNEHLGSLVDKLTRGGGDIIKFAGDALLVAFPVTEGSDLGEQTLRATQLSLECIAELQAAGTVEGVTLTARSGIGVGDATGFLVGGAFNRSEYAFIGDPVYQAVAGEVTGSDGETVISAEGWALLNGRAEGTETANGNWTVSSIKEGDQLPPESLDRVSSGQKVLEAWSKRSQSLIDEIRLRCEDKDGMNRCADELKHVVPGAVRNRLPEFTPTAIPSISELRFVTVVLARVSGLEFEQGEGGIEGLRKVQTVAKLIQETVYVHDGNFMRFSIDDLGAVAMGIFGLPPSHENDPERGVGCGIDICRQVQSRAEEFGGVKASVGIASGYCWLGLVGGISRCEYTIQGPTNSTAAQLMCASEDGVMADRATRDACVQTATKQSFIFESKTPSSVPSQQPQAMPGLLRSSSNFQAEQQRVSECFLVSRNPSAVTSPKSQSNGLVMKLDEGTVDEESDTQEWAVKRLEVLSRLAPYRLLRHVIAQHEGRKQKAEEAAVEGPSSGDAAASAAAPAATETDPADAKLSELNTLWVADISDDAVAKGVPWVEEQLAKLFASYGTVDSVTVREKHNDATSSRGALNQSWGLVTFDLEGVGRADFKGAIAATLELEGQKLWVEIAKARKELRRETTGALASMLEAQSFKTKSLSSETDQQNFYDRTTCAAMFIDISGFSKITRILFAKHGLEGVEVLASTLNTYLGRMVDRLTQCGGDVIKFAGDAALVIFTVTEQADLAQQTLKATQLSLECIADLEAGEAVVEGVALTAHTGIGVGDATGFLVGGVFNRSEYAIIGEPVFQIASAEPAAGDGETVISAAGWELIKDRAEGRLTTDDNWLVTAIKPEFQLSGAALGDLEGAGGILDELAALTKEAANKAAGEIKTVVPGGVRNRLPDFTPDSMPCMSEFRLVTMLFARIQGLDYSRGDAELRKIQTIVKIIQQTIYTHDGIFLRFSVDDKGAVVMGCYGLPPSHTDDPERGVMASLDFSRQIHSEHKEELDGVRVSVGLTTGYCWLGLVGGVSRCEYTTHAPIINLAARLMCSTDDQVTVDLATKEACEQTNKRVSFDPKLPIMAKGFDEPVQIFVPRLIATTNMALKHWAGKGA